MRIIDQRLIGRLQSEEYRPTILMTIDDGYNILRFTTWDEALNFQSDLYLPRGIDVGGISYGSSNIVNRCNLEVDDVDRAIYSSLTSTSELTPECELYLAVINSAGTISSGYSAKIFSGIIAEWSYSPGRVSLVMASFFTKWSKETTRVFSTSCNVKIFKSPQCGYTGSATTCDRTYTTCENYGNTVNFQGFRWLEDMMNKSLEA